MREKLVLDIVGKLRGRDDWEIILAEIHGMLLGECNPKDREVDIDQMAREFQAADDTAEVWAIRQEARLKGIG